MRHVIILELVCGGGGNFFLYLHKGAGEGTGEDQ